MRVHADRQRWVPELLEGTFVEVDEWGESARRTTDDGQHQWQAVARGADHRLRAAPDTHPCREVSCWEGRTHVLVDERCSDGAGPGHRLVADQSHEQVKLLLEEGLVVGEVEPEQRKGVGQRTTTDDELRSAVRHRVEGRKLGIYSHRVLRAQDR